MISCNFSVYFDTGRTLKSTVEGIKTDGIAIFP